MINTNSGYLLGIFNAQIKAADSFKRLGLIRDTVCICRNELSPEAVNYLLTRILVRADDLKYVSR